MLSSSVKSSGSPPTQQPLAFSIWIRETTILICNLVEIEDGKLESHYELGMRTPFTVTEASAATGDAKDVADDPGELIIYSGRSESLVGPIIRQFADTTGIDVQVKYGKTGALAATLLEEGDKSPARRILRPRPRRTGRRFTHDGRAAK